MSELGEGSDTGAKRPILYTFCYVRIGSMLSLLQMKCGCEQIVHNRLTGCGWERRKNLL